MAQRINEFLINAVMDNKTLTDVKQSLIAEMERRVQDKILEPTNAALLKKLITNADDDNEATMIAALGTTYKRTGFHFDKRLEKLSSDIKYFKKNERLSFLTDSSKPTHKLIIGDNYEALQNLLIEYKGKIDVIYIDPPYGKDSMGEFAQTNYENAITRDNLLSMLYPRLVLAKELLSEKGVIFCSIDDRNQAYVKSLFDEVFGEKKLVCNLVWQKKTGASDAKGIAIITEYILVYCNDPEEKYWNKIFTQNYMSYDERRYRFSDEYVFERGKYYPDNLDRGGLNYSDSMNYGIECPDGTIAYPNGRTKYENDGWIWKWSKEKVQWGIDFGFIEFRKSKDKKSGWAVCYKNYLYVDNEGKKINRSAPFKNFIYGILNGEGTDEMNNIFGMSVFKNPKPIALIMYILQAVSKKDLLVLDFFAGSGTTGHSVMELNRNSKNQRAKFILVQSPETLDKQSKKPEVKNAIKLCEKLNLPLNIAQITAIRLKRIMTGECYDGNKDFKWLEDNEPYGSNLDVYEIASVKNNNSSSGKTPFDVIDETLYGKKQFAILREKVDWVCSNFAHAQQSVESDKEWQERIKKM